MRVLVLGTGGREHALVRALAADPGVTALHAAPGNPGIGELAELHAVTPADPGSVLALAARTRADLVVIGPEAPLVAGVADALREAGVSCFGPGRGAAMIEGSKSFAKDVMVAAGIPTAAARTCVSASRASASRASADAASAAGASAAGASAAGASAAGASAAGAALDAFGPPYVVKADGLAAGKGVVVTRDRGEALAHARDCGTVVIEEFLDGPEISIFALADGTTAIPLMPAQDFKRAHDGDAGPNTGGMGAYAPLPWAPPDLIDETLATVIQPALAELKRRGTPYSGLLYTGLCLTARGLRVVEFNARFGDPETQVILDRLTTPLGGLLAAAADGGLAGAAAAGLSWAPGAAVTVVIAAESYPGTPASGDEIDGISAAGRQPGAYVLHAGTSLRHGTLVSSGGRVLNIVGTGPDVARARAAAYAAAGKISMRGGWYRRDIAQNPAPGTPAGL
jgi:phosphoribosylamine--glycine ligase